MDHPRPGALQLIGIVKQYGVYDSKRAISGIDLEVQNGEFLAIVGPSGSGKSTLLQIAGLMLMPEEGTVLLRGQEVKRMTKGTVARLRAQEIGFVFQKPNLLSEFSVLENIMVAAYMASGKRDQAALPYAKKLLIQAGLSPWEARRPHELSETQKKLACLIRALVNMPSLLLLDEPLGDLDDNSAELVCKLIDSVRGQFGTTCLAVSSGRRLAERADRILRLNEGKVTGTFSR